MQGQRLQWTDRGRFLMLVMMEHPLTMTSLMMLLMIPMMGMLVVMIS